ncbi:MAG: hypothetical protein JO222_09835, partial [Frankiales bacterium]|nr:hypothetical protein [Frankiales bacterium]
MADRPAPGANGATPTANIRVGLFPAALNGASHQPEQMLAILNRIPPGSVDHLSVGDHVSFFVGAGSDGLV